MAEPVFRWGMQPGGKSIAPQTVGAPATTSIPSGGGGGILDTLLGVAGLGMNIYDKVWGPGRLKDDLAIQIQQENLKKIKADALAAQAAREQAEYERRTEAVTGQKFSPELAQATTATRDIMMNKGGGRGEVGPLGGPTAAISSPDDPGAGLVARPYGRIGILPETLGKEAANLRASSEAGLENMPPGTARDRARSQIVTAPQITLPSQVPEVYGKYAAAGKAGAEEVAAEQKGAAAAAQLSAMDRYRATKDRRYLIEAMTHDSAGPGQVLEMERKDAEAAVAHFEKMQDAKLKYAEAVKKGYANPQMMESMTRDINLMQIGFSRLTNNPNVMLHPTTSTPGIIYGRNYKVNNYVTDMETANRYVTGQMNPANASDLLALAGINLAINKHPSAKFSADEAAALSRYIAEYPGAPIGTIREAQQWIRENSEAEPPQQAFQGEEVPYTPSTAPTPERQQYTGEAPPTAGTAPVPKAAPAPVPGVDIPDTPEARGIQERWGTQPGRREPFMRMPPPDANAPKSPVTGPNAAQLGAYAKDVARSVVGKRTREQVAKDQGTYAPMAIQEANAQGVPANLITRMFNHESGWNPNAHAVKTDAVGIAQLRRGAAADMGLSPQDRWDPAKNIKAGVGYLARQLKTFGGSQPLAVAAYHMGAGDLKSGVNWGPETRKYVQIALGLPSPVTDEQIREWVTPLGIAYQSKPIRRAG